jgi:potassium-transporting ATPase KdpC subunit
MIKLLKSSVIILLGFTILTGLIYPLIITGFAQLFFPGQANGSLIFKNSNVIGSSLIGQYFNQPRYFWGRLSATGMQPYNASASGGSNLSMTNPDLVSNVKNRIQELLKVDSSNPLPIPIDLVTSSASGLDPDISVAAALYQAQRIARVHGLPIDTVIKLIQDHTQNRKFGFLGEPRVNVLELNLALDALQ